jgi:hypothetical protein
MASQPNRKVTMNDKVLPPPRRQLIQERRNRVFELRAAGYSHAEVGALMNPPISSQRVGQILRGKRVLKQRQSKNNRRPG